MMVMVEACRHRPLWPL
jgi:hypothetical protein